MTPSERTKIKIIWFGVSERVSKLKTTLQQRNRDLNILSFLTSKTPSIKKVKINIL